MYATLADFALYMRVSEQALPVDTQRYLDRANELIEMMVYRNYDSTRTDHADACTKAVCAQVESWSEFGEQSSMANGISSIKVGEFSITYSDLQKVTSVCVRSTQYLNRVGLLYRGL